MRVPQFLLFTLGLSAMMALFGCSRESSVKENVNLKNNHSRVFAFNTPIENPSAFAAASDSAVGVSVRCVSTSSAIFRRKYRSIPERARISSTVRPRRSPS